MRICIPDSETRYLTVTPADVGELEKTILALESDQGLLSCPLEVAGGIGSTLLNFTLPDFTPQEALALLDIYVIAAERTVAECEAGRKLCHRKMAELSGFRVIEGGGVKGATV